jgi:hypothetical protein
MNRTPMEEFEVTEKKKEMCPFDPEQPRAENCKYGEECPWYVEEGHKDCFCAVGEPPDLMLNKMLAAKVKKDE